jgi:lipopolysaccharide assembly protein A
MIIFLLLGLLLGGLTVVFALQNVTPVTVSFLSWEFEGSLALILVLAVVSGLLISSLLSLPTAIQRRLQISRLRNENLRLKEELGHKVVEVQEEKSKVAAANAYLDELENKPKV